MFQSQPETCRTSISTRSCREVHDVTASRGDRRPLVSVRRKNSSVVDSQELTTTLSSTCDLTSENLQTHKERHISVQQLHRDASKRRLRVKLPENKPAYIKWTLLPQWHRLVLFCQQLSFKTLWTLRIRDYNVDSPFLNTVNSNELHLQRDEGVNAKLHLIFTIFSSVCNTVTTSACHKHKSV